MPPRIAALVALLVITSATFLASGNDRDIARNITHELREQSQAGALKDFDVRLVVKNGCVFLTGHVSSVEQYKLVGEITDTIDGVTAVRNRLGLRIQDEPRLISDHDSPQDIAEAKESRFGRTRGDETTSCLPNALIDVFLGKRSSECETVITASSSMAGAEVSGSIHPTRETHLVLAEIRQQIAKEKQLGNLRGFNITMSFDDGTLMLTGHVSNKQQLDLVADAANAMRGVASVNNQLAIREDQPAPSPQEAAVRREVTPLD